MGLRMVKIEPKAANAFDIEVYDYLGKHRYTLQVHTDGERLQILARDAKGEHTTLVATKGHIMDKQEPFEFSVLHIKPVEKNPYEGLGALFQ